MVVDPSMREYYERRAREYDDWWLGTGLFAGRDRPGWHAEVDALGTALAGLAPARVLDVACGTGFMTRRLRGEVTALDQSAKMVEVASWRLPDARVVQGEAVPLPFPDDSFDRVYTGHFYGHLAPGERTEFLAEAARVAPELVIVDSALRDGVEREEQQERVLDDGSRHEVYKRYFDPDELAAEIGGGDVIHAGLWFVAVRGRSGRPG
ncbi:MAG: hypothetical protein QOJ07_402 [Thermoleophilaceae bacterium]|jgi:demethylmenaquinone methyltransferase/2-methoxy-6-polyprenyl-1,4-benzoquinol methylase|nr:hypothetical protein [Thermoleophilaceae bacterium]